MIIVGLAEEYGGPFHGSPEYRPMKTIPVTVLVLACAVPTAGLSAQDAGADRPLLHPLFTDHMVLQRDVMTSVWGWTQPGTKVQVTLADKTATGVADARGKFPAVKPRPKVNRRGLGCLRQRQHLDPPGNAQAKHQQNDEPTVTSNVALHPRNLLLSLAHVWSSTVRSLSVHLPYGQQDDEGRV